MVTSWYLPQLRNTTSPDGLAQAFLIGEDFIERRCLFGSWRQHFYGHGFSEYTRSLRNNNGATSLAIESNNLDIWSVEFDDQMNVVSLEEKPSSPKSHSLSPDSIFTNLMW